MNIPNRIMVDAQQWLLELEGGTADEDLRTQFEAWLQADPRHDQAYRLSQAAWCGAAQLSHLADLEPRYRETEVSLRERLTAILNNHLTAFVLTTVAIAAVTLPLVWLKWSADAVGTEYATAVADIGEYTLADGSVVILGGRSHIVVTIGDRQRHVLLKTGEVFFNISKDPRRPFTVQAENTRVEVLGTAFNVHSGAERVTIAVAEGVVEVVNEGPQSESQQQLAAGHQVVSSRYRGLSEVQSIKTAEVGSWRRGLMSYNQAPLRKVIADANRYSDTEIVLADESVGELTVTASYNSADIDKMIESLGDILPVEVVPTPYGAILVKGR